uniref:Pfam-B_9067 domain containing protein n=1 Tax=Echinococcus granulosus TaxID=6210 RepID=A0A068X007_ECHGR|nr:Pfam-B_9067 domain containing protein [Echinococcus granulosus]
MGNFRKNRSNEQLSRLKVRKVLGVGDRFGNGSISKISQILGSVAFTRREQKPSLIWWLRTLSFLMTLSVISVSIKAKF